MKFDTQPTLENGLIKIQPLKPNDFETLYQIAADPLIWTQHPNPDRYQKTVFESFFKGAIESQGAFLVFDKQTGIAIGSSRFYEFDAAAQTIAIGYTFLARDHWGTTYNRALKSLMLNHAFKYVDNVQFHIGTNNIRSQKAIEKLGAIKVSDCAANFIYQIDKQQWEQQQS